MLDIDFIRDNVGQVKAAAKAKGSGVDIDTLLEIDGHRRSLIEQVDSVRAERNEHTESMKGGRPSDEQIAKGKELKETIAALEEKLSGIEAEYTELLHAVPNVHSDDTPVGASEDENIVTKTWGEKPEFNFTPKPHWEMTHLIDEERAVRISGARFSFLKGGLVRLQFALVQFGLDVLTNEDTLKEIAASSQLDVSTKPFVPMLAPMMMRTEPYAATGRLKPDDVTFKLNNDDLWLTGSSEHTMCAYHMGEVLGWDELPIRYVGYNTAFRREVGSAGKDTRGIIRQHQFDKLEMESFTAPEDSRAEHEFMIAIQEYLMQQINQPYQVILKCTFDMGGPNFRGVDIETWMAGQGLYRETHSADLMTDYQARGLNTKYVNSDGKKALVHTNDATAFAQRALIAILENNQQEDGRILVPEVLRGYMNGVEYI